MLHHVLGNQDACLVVIRHNGRIHFYILTDRRIHYDDFNTSFLGLLKRGNNTWTIAFYRIDDNDINLFSDKKVNLLALLALIQLRIPNVEPAALLVSFLLQLRI